MSVEWLHAEKASVGINVAMATRLLGMSRSNYYAKPKRQPSKRQQEDEKLMEKVSNIFEAHKQRYGSPRIHHELKRAGTHVSRKRVIKCMKNKDLRARIFRRWAHTTNSQHALPKAQNLLVRDFSATAPNQTWLGDVTYLR
ncbi:MAG: IS3 family transposase, partial [Proteobacteria bacterium]|nr:IS3 family transposase [Pseudomonadota bacterium]